MDGCGLVWRLDFRVPLFLPLSLPGVLGFDGVEKSRCASAKKYRSPSITHGGLFATKSSATDGNADRGGGGRGLGGGETTATFRPTELDDDDARRGTARALQFFRLNERRSERRRAVRGGGGLDWGNFVANNASQSQFGSDGARETEREWMGMGWDCFWLISW